MSAITAIGPLLRAAPSLDPKV